MLAKKNVFPSRASVGQKSLAAELIGAPTFTGSLHGSASLALLATQMSSPPKPPVRFEAMKNIFPSGDTNGQPSVLAVLKPSAAPAPKLSMSTASPQSPNAAAAIAPESIVTITATTMVILRLIVYLLWAECSRHLHR